MTAQKSDQQLMVPSAVDDQYAGCRDKALETFIKGDLLNKEMNLNTDFLKAWDKQKPCSKQNPKNPDEHLAALSAYDNGDEMFINEFNNAVRNLGANATVYKTQFHFKSFHFLLVDSMMELQQKDCKTVYAMSSHQYEASKGSKIRLGQFLKAYFSFNNLKKIEPDFEDNLILNITSCFFAKIGANVCSKDDAVLLSPAEVFTVEDLVPVSDKEDDTEYRVMTLKHAELFSYHNCYIFSR